MASPQPQPQWMVGVFRGGNYHADARGNHPSQLQLAGPMGPPGGFGSSGGGGGGGGSQAGRLSINGSAEPLDPAMPWAGMLSSRYMGTLTHMLGERPPPPHHARTTRAPRAHHARPYPTRTPQRLAAAPPSHCQRLPASPSPDPPH
jgi:hypothetical protein